MIIDDEIHTATIDLPASIKGYTMALMDGTYCVVLNQKLTYEQRMKTFAHEYKHIMDGDFSKFDVNNIESDAHSE